MSTLQAGTLTNQLTENQVLQLVAEALDVPASKLTLTSQATDLTEWDSMGILAILSVLDREGIKCDIGNSESLQSVAGIMQTCRQAGRLKG